MPPVPRGFETPAYWTVETGPNWLGRHQPPFREYSMWCKPLAKCESGRYRQKYRHLSCLPADASGLWRIDMPDLNMVPVCALLDPQRRAQRFMAARLVQLTGTRAGGFVLTRQEAAGKWGAATYSLIRTVKEAWGS